LFVLHSSSCCKENPRILRSTSVSNGRVSQSCFVILVGFNTPLPGRDPVLGRSCVPDLSRRFGVASAILRLSAAVCSRLVVPGLVALLGFVVLACLVADSGHVLGGASDAHVPSVAADSSFRCRLHDLVKAVSLDGYLGHHDASHSFV
jgi:hypothetical protein